MTHNNGGSHIIPLILINETKLHPFFLPSDKMKLLSLLPYSDVASGLFYFSLCKTIPCMRFTLQTLIKGGKNDLAQQA